MQMRFAFSLPAWLLPRKLRDDLASRERYFGKARKTWRWLGRFDEISLTVRTDRP